MVMMNLASTSRLLVLFHSCYIVNSLGNEISRRVILQIAAVAPSFRLHQVLAFEGGVGGLGKTKPSTGVNLREGSAPIQNKQGIVSAEIIGGTGNPILVQFQTPWPLLATTAGLEARDLLNSESAFVQVVPNIKEGTTGKALNAAIIGNLFSSKGKYGAYGEPTDIKIRTLDTSSGLLSISFTAYTPAMRESERKLYVNIQFAEDSLVMLVTGTTLQRFKSQEEMLRQVADSFVVISAPKSGFARY
jgi:hypothetical protein